MTRLADITNQHILEYITGTSSRTIDTSAFVDHLTHEIGSFYQVPCSFRYDVSLNEPVNTVVDWERQHDHEVSINENAQSNITTRSECDLCKECGVHLQPIDVKDRVMFICAYCRRRHRVCEQCGDITISPVEVITEDNNVHILCRSCAKDRCTTCDSCGFTKFKEDVLEVEERELCKKCYVLNTSECAKCHQRCITTHSHTVFTGFDLETFEYNNKQHICHGCFCNSDYICCTSCGVVCSLDLGHIDDDGRQQCIACYENEKLIHKYNYLPRFKKYKLPHEQDVPSTTFIGIETEIEDIQRRPNKYQTMTAKKITQDMPFIYCMHDGSISCGFEIATMPLSWNFIRQNEDKFLPLFNLTKEGWRSFETSTCGMHIHLSKNSFSSLGLFKFLKFFYDNPQFIILVSQRDNIHSLNRWANLRTRQRLIDKAKTKYQTESKYTAINLLHENSVEVRVFRGTLNPRTFFKNIEFCKAVMDFTRNSSVKHVTMLNFLDFVNKEKESFPRLYSFLNNSGILTKNSIQEWFTDRRTCIEIPPKAIRDVPFAPSACVQVVDLP